MSDPIHKSYNPRDPHPDLLAVPGNDDGRYRDCYVLLSIDAVDGKVYFVIESSNEYPSTPEEMQHSRRFCYEEHSCPTNFIPVLIMCHNGDNDPHHIIHFEDVIWKVQPEEGEEHDDEYFLNAFPQMRAQK